MNRIYLDVIQSRTLKHIDEVAPLADADFAVLAEIGDVLRKHGSNERFGICLLHKHFDLAENEELIEETDETERVSRLSVRPRGTGSSAIETMWRFSTDSSAITKCEQKCDKNFGHKPIHEKVAR
ncbi:MAG: hypothetical protein WDN30_09855 [Pararobbsia sp.]